MIVGLGHSGRMHAACLAKLLSDGDRPVIHAVDPAGAAVAGVAMIDSPAEIDPARRAACVVHLCTPPEIRTAPFKTALELGYRQFIIEKPLAGDAAALVEIGALRDLYDASVVVVSNWTASEMTREIARVIAAGAVPREITIRQNKLRITRSRTNRSHVSALDVEMPHMLALAAMLAGPDIALQSAALWWLEAGETRIADMGGARVELSFNGSGVVRLETDHLSSVSERSIRIDFNDGSWLTGYFPLNGVELHSQLFRYDAGGALTGRRFFEDDTLTQFLSDAYAFFDGGPEPVSSFDFNRRLCVMLDQVREHCRAAA